LPGNKSSAFLKLLWNNRTAQHDVDRVLCRSNAEALVFLEARELVKGKMKLIFAEIMRELKASGYHVSARLMNAMYFGVPQSQLGMIFVGKRKDL
jgi:DNA (cytosine-5)-methyltransferase 1